MRELFVLYRGTVLAYCSEADANLLVLRKIKTKSVVWELIERMFLTTIFRMKTCSSIKICYSTIYETCWKNCEKFKEKIAVCFVFFVWLEKRAPCIIQKEYSKYHKLRQNAFKLVESIATFSTFPTVKLALNKKKCQVVSLPRSPEQIDKHKIFNVFSLFYWNTGIVRLMPFNRISHQDLFSLCEFNEKIK